MQVIHFKKSHVHTTEHKRLGTKAKCKDFVDKSENEQIDNSKQINGQNGDNLNEPIISNHIAIVSEVAVNAPTLDLFPGFLFTAVLIQSFFCLLEMRLALKSTSTFYLKLIYHLQPNLMTPSYFFPTLILHS